MSKGFTKKANITTAFMALTYWFNFNLYQCMHGERILLSRLFVRSTSVCARNKGLSLIRKRKESWDARLVSDLALSYIYFRSNPTQQLIVPVVKHHDSTDFTSRSSDFKQPLTLPNAWFGTPSKTSWKTQVSFLKLSTKERAFISRTLLGEFFSP